MPTGKIERQTNRLDVISELRWSVYTPTIKDFEDKIKQYEEDEYGNSGYCKAVAKINKSEDFDECAGTIIEWLNKWTMRLPADGSGKAKKLQAEIAEFLRNNVKQIKNLNYDITKINNMKNDYETILGFYRDLKEIKYIKATAVSKILHILNPELFVMWDKKIMEKNGYGDGCKCYLAFLQEMGCIGVSLLEKSPDVVKYLNENYKDKHCGQNFTLSKFLDEYNFMKRGES
jgi:hypothetical protein